MTRELTAEQETRLVELRRAANQFCATIDCAEEMALDDLIESLAEALPELQWRAQRLPEGDLPDDDDETDESRRVVSQEIAKNHHRWHEDVIALVQRKLGEREVYYATFDPRQPDIEGLANSPSSLANDIADIYCNLKGALLADRHGAETEAERLWHWRFEFRSHWGIYHVPRAIQALSWLVNPGDFDDDDDLTEQDGSTTLDDEVQHA